MNRVFYPIKWVLGIVKDIAVSVANRVALDIFTSYHHFRNDDKWKEIENLTNAIKALEENKIDDAKGKYLSDLIGKLEEFEDKTVTTELLLTALKSHRFWIWSLTKGVKADQTLCVYISNYIAPLQSPLRKSSTRKIDATHIPFNINE